MRTLIVGLCTAGAMYSYNAWGMKGGLIAIAGIFALSGALFLFSYLVECWIDRRQNRG